MIVSVLVRLAIIALGVYVAAAIVPGVQLEGTAGSLLVVSLLLAVVNLLVRPVVKLLSLPFVLLTFGLFLVVINAAMLGLTAALTPRLEIDGVLAALLGALVISVVTFFAERVLPGRR